MSIIHRIDIVLGKPLMRALCNRERDAIVVQGNAGRLAQDASANWPGKCLVEKA